MNFEKMESTTTAGKTHIQFLYMKDSLQSNASLWEDEPSELYVCILCEKTFYNAKALQNHKNLNHDADASSSEPDQNSTASHNSNQIVDGLCGFKFLPKRVEIKNTVVEIDGLMKCVFNEDTSYLIVKVEGDESELNALKRSRLAGIIRRNQIKQGKQPVDLRGPFTCTLPSTVRPDLQCRQIFFDCCEYSLHYREEHTKRRKAALRCQVCERALEREGPAAAAPAQPFATATGAAASEERARLALAKTKPHQCTVCAKRFTQQGGLQQHMRMHTGVRPFACTYCPKAFTQKAGLDQHLRTHTKVKPFKCVVCGKSFSQSVHLRQHMRTHTNIQPFECAACGRRFKQSSHLNFHMRSHAFDGSFEAQRSPEPQPQPQPLPLPQPRSLFNQVPVAHIDFFNLSKLQRVNDGETVYFAAELAEPVSEPTIYHFPTPENAL